MRITCLLLFVLAAAGCSGTATSPSASPSATTSPTPTRTPRPPTPTPAIRAEYLTPMPQPQLDTTLVNLFETNADCELPCWWGITPGTSTLNDALLLLEPLSYLIDYVDLEITAYISGGEAFDNNSFWQFYWLTQGGVIQRISVEIVKEYPFMLTDVIDQYGLPDNIILANAYDLLDEDTIYYALYEEDGFLITYYALVRVNGEMLVVCPNLSRGYSLRIWDVNEGTSIDWVIHTWDLSISIDPTNKEYVQISEETEFSISDFIDLYQQPGACFETPGSIWSDFNGVGVGADYRP